MKPKFLSVRRLLDTQQAQKAVGILEELKILSALEEQEKYYLLGWAHMLLQQWEAARVALDILLPPSLQQHVEGEENFTTRELLAVFQLRLGSAATSLDELVEATQHLNACLAALQNRSIQRPDLKYRASVALGQVLLKRHLPYPALERFKDARRYGHSASTTEWEANLHEYSALVYQQLNDWNMMGKEAKEALQMYISSGNLPKQAQMYLLLGAWSANVAPEETQEYYTLALQRAHDCDNPGLTVQACIELSRYYRSTGDVRSAISYSVLARANAVLVENREVRVRALIESCYANASMLTLNGTDKLTLLEQELFWVQEALRLSLEQDHPTLASDVYYVQGQVLEALGRTRDASEAYTMAVKLGGKKSDRKEN